jgi:thiol-disulfide isomerase/thioredoxin
MAMRTKTMILYGALVLIAVWLVYSIFFPRSSRRLLQGFQNPSEPTFTMYYAPWCGHCKNAKPAFDEFAKDGRVKIGEKSCVVRAVDPEKQPEEAKGKPVRGFPTFLLELPNGVIKEYKGERTTAGYLEFLNKELGGGV